MPIDSVVTAAENRDLTILDAVKLELGLTGLSDDALIEALITQASDRIATILGRFLPCERVIEKVPGQGMKRIMLSRRPIVTVHSVTYDSSAVSDYELDDAEAGLLYRPSGWSWSAGVWWGATPESVARSEENVFSINYTGGYVTPAQVEVAQYETRTLPYDIERACILLTKAAYRSAQRDPGIISESIGDYSVRFASGEINDEIVRILAPWVDSI